jgi:hypothetical protein
MSHGAALFFNLESIIVQCKLCFSQSSLQKAITVKTAFTRVTIFIYFSCRRIIKK